MNREIEKKIGAKIRELREKKGITQELLSTHLQVFGCDITRSALAKIEVGQRHIYADEIIAFVKTLGVDYKEIFDIEFENE